MPGHCGCPHACAATGRETQGTRPENDAAPGQLLLRIPAMDCAMEEGQIRRALEGFPDIRHLSFDLPARLLRVDVPPARWAEIRAAIGRAGFSTEFLPDPVRTEAVQAGNPFLRPVVALMLALTAELVAYAAPATPAWQSAGMGIAGLAIALSGVSVFRHGVHAILHARLDINALMSVAVAGAFAIGEWPEAAMVMALFELAERIEARAVERARNAIKSLLDLSPQEAETRQFDGQWKPVAVKDVSPGAIVRVRPGERIALDGRIVAGQSSLDQSPLTGESMPIEKGPGDEVFAGTINQCGALEFVVTAPAGDTLLARIIHAVEEAQGARAPMQRLVDRFAATYTPAVFVLAIALALAGPLLLAWTWPASVYKALVMLVIACPCALVISTPVTIVSGLAAASRRGILIKGGAYLETAHKLAVLALDKTGTVTEGRPRLVARIHLDPGVEEARVARIAAALAERSDHPVARAIVRGLGAQEDVEVRDFSAMAGRGLLGRVAGTDYVLGNHRWMRERNQCSVELDALMARHERQGHTLAVLADPSGPLALFAVADAIKPGAREAIAELLAMGVHPVLLTGDNAVTAANIAGQAGIQDVRANLLPLEKQKAIRDLVDSGRLVAMVGDGINDAPALSTASIGFAMGRAGTHTAMEAADVVIMNDDLRRVPEILRLSRRTQRVLWQNIGLALGIKLVFLLWAILGGATMWMAVFADMGASLLVVANGLRLLKEDRSASARSPRSIARTAASPGCTGR
ncbi:MAG TPA: cation-translocating P-type ATPase [Thiobacillaceae bacterium]|nr:cation-translocating P-type ATPase [Thiobacillaceae bacterium]